MNECGSEFRVFEGRRAESGEVEIKLARRKNTNRELLGMYATVSTFHCCWPLLIGVGPRNRT